LLAGGSGADVDVRELSGQALQIDFARDIMPIFESRCVSCHSSAAPAGDLALDVAGTEAGSTWSCLISDRGQTCVPAERRIVTGAGSGGVLFRRPQLTRYVRAFNALASPLYWKAAGMRTDGRTDDTFTDASPRDDIDIDFVLALARSHVARLIAALPQFYAAEEALYLAVDNRGTASLIHQDTQLKVDLFVAGGTPLDDQQLALCHLPQ
jgi:hypothetical protein